MGRTNIKAGSVGVPSLSCKTASPLQSDPSIHHQYHSLPVERPFQPTSSRPNPTHPLARSSTNQLPSTRREKHARRQRLDAVPDLQLPRLARDALRDVRRYWTGRRRLPVQRVRRRRVDALCRVLHVPRAKGVAAQFAVRRSSGRES